MSARRVLSFLQKGWTAFVDPEREQRLERAVSGVHKELSSLREGFDYRVVADRLDVPAEDREEVARRLFGKCVSKAWSDNDLTDKEKRSLTWIAGKLGLPTDEVSTVLRSQAESAFSTTLACAFEDGILDDAEYQSLERIAATCGFTPTEFFRSRFREQGEGFIRNLFVRVLEDGQLDQDDWTSLMMAVRRLGMSDAEFRDAIRAPAQQLVEHLLADFKSDAEITSDEDACLSWMVKHLIDDRDFAGYVQSQVTETKRLSTIRSGHLPSLDAPQGVAIKAGEIVHFVSPCRYTYMRRRGSEQVHGTAVITDDRLIFASAERSLQIIHSKVLGFQRLSRGLDIQCAGSSAGSYEFTGDARFGIEIWLTAIGKANQTIVTPRKENDARRIPRDVRQRVWQRYGGRCAECNSNQYLEFDHIVPVARGGGNSENNIQLLCRGCNSKKSDAI